MADVTFCQSGVGMIFVARNHRPWLLLSCQEDMAAEPKKAPHKEAHCKII